MDHANAGRLIQPAVTDSDAPSQWADSGSGSGTFTKALADLLFDGSVITAIDREAHKIVSPNKNIAINFVQSDFQNSKSIPEQLDGIIIANALHYVKDQAGFLNSIKSHFTPSGRLIIIEYDTDHSNQWVPYPVTFITLQKILKEAGFTSVTKIGERDSIYRKEKIYACVAKV